MEGRITILERRATVNHDLREALQDLVEAVQGLLKDEGDFAAVRLVRAQKAAEELLQAELGRRTV